LNGTFSVTRLGGILLVTATTRGVGAGVDARDDSAVELPRPLTPFKDGYAALWFVVVGRDDGIDVAEGAGRLAPHDTGFAVVGFGPLPRAGKSPSEFKFGGTDCFLRCRGDDGVA